MENLLLFITIIQSSKASQSIKSCKYRSRVSVKAHVTHQYEEISDLTDLLCVVVPEGQV